MKYNKLYLRLSIVPQTEDLQTDSLEFKNFKDKYLESKEFVKDADILYAYYNDNMSPSFNRIRAITLGCIHEDKAIIKVLKGEEKDLLNHLVNSLKSDYFKEAELVSFNNIFNQGYIKARKFKNNIPLHDGVKQIKTLGERPWTLKLQKGVAEYMKGVDYWTYNFNQMCLDKSISTDMIIDGADVYSYLKSGKEKEVDDSDISYVFNLINLDRASEDLEPITDLTRSIEVLGTVEEAKDTRSIFEKLYEEGYLTEKLAAEIKDTIGKKKVLIRDKKKIGDILLAVISQNDFINQRQDTKAQKEEKILQVKEFIKTL